MLAGEAAEHLLDHSEQICFKYGSAVTLGDLFDFLLLADGVALLGVSLLGVDDLVGEAFGNGLH